MMKSLLNRFFLLTLGLITAQLSADAQCTPCGTGADGAFVASSSTTLAGGTYNFTSVTIDAGVTVTVTGSQPLIIYSSGTVTINGMLMANGANGTDGVTYSTGGTGGAGVAGGANGGDGTYSSTSGPLPGMSGSGDGAGMLGANWSGGGGAGYGTAGQSASSTDGFGGPAYNDPFITTITGGSGGAGGSGGYSCGSGGGGGGGGYISISSCGAMMIGASGMITANGGNGGSDGSGNCGGGGGGSGGSIYINTSSFTNNGMITAVGGNGGASNLIGAPYYGIGGNGAVGRIRFDNISAAGTGTVSPAAFNGSIMAAPTTTQACPSGCNGTATANVSGGTPGYTYMWAPGGSTASTLTGLCAGTYTVTVTDANGCATTSPVIVSEGDATAPVADVASLPMLMGECNVNITTAPTATDNCAAAITGTTSDPLSYTTQGTYTITWTYDDGNGNTSTQTQSVMVSDMTAPVANAASLADITGYCSATVSAAPAATDACTGTVTGTTADALSYNTAGTHMITWTYDDGNGNTSTQTQQVIVMTVDTAVSVSGLTFTANAAGASYAWLNCALGTTIPGETNQSYTASGNGSYALIITQGGCSDTSACYSITTVGIAEATAASVQAYPNPTSGLLNLDLGAMKEGQIAVQNMVGQVLHTQRISSERTTIDLSGFDNGVFFIHVTTADATQVIRVIKNK